MVQIVRLGCSVSEKTKSTLLMVTLKVMSIFFQPPIVPQVSHSGDARNFDKYPEDGWLSTPPVTEAELEPFKDF